MNAEKKNMRLSLALKKNLKKRFPDPLKIRENPDFP